MNGQTMNTERKTKKKRELTPRQKRFVEEYLVDSNGTQAAIRAGYSEKSADVTASQLIANPKIEVAIRKAKDANAEKLDITVERVLLEYMRLALANTSDIMRVEMITIQTDDGKRWRVPRTTIKPTDEWPAALCSAVSEIGTTASGAIKIKTHSKTDALEALARYFGIFNDKLKVSGSLSFSDLIKLAKSSDAKTDGE